MRNLIALTVATTFAGLMAFTAPAFAGRYHSTYKIVACSTKCAAYKGCVNHSNCDTYRDSTKSPAVCKIGYDKTCKFPTKK